MMVSFIYGGFIPRQSSVSFHSSLQVFVLLLGLLQALIQLHVFLRLSQTNHDAVKQKKTKNKFKLQIFRDDILTSFSNSISFFSCWWSCSVFMSKTTLRLSSSCSKYRMCESFCTAKHSDRKTSKCCSGTLSTTQCQDPNMRTCGCKPTTLKISDGLVLQQHFSEIKIHRGRAVFTQTPPSVG